MVQGDPEILEFLNEVLTAELTAVNQYFLHAKMCSNWGYDHLAEKIRSESMDEMRDADSIIERILYFEGHPNLQRLGTVQVGETVDEQLRLDLEVEKEAIERYNRGIALAVTKGDNGTRHLLESQLEGEESHADWLETQLSLIEQVGLDNYLSEQIRD
jgi:bacterioferritin